VTPEDAEREPRIKERGTCLDGHGELPPDEIMWGLNDIDHGGDCVFLAGGNRCTIYDTRPDMCRAFGPHCASCEQYDGPALEDPCPCGSDYTYAECCYDCDAPVIEPAEREAGESPRQEKT